MRGKYFKLKVLAITSFSLIDYVFKFILVKISI